MTKSESPKSQSLKSLMQNKVRASALKNRGKKIIDILCTYRKMRKNDVKNHFSCSKVCISQKKAVILPRKIEERRLICEQQQRISMNE